jgi:SAM-dependent methyltransferase
MVSENTASITEKYHSHNDAPTVQVFSESDEYVDLNSQFVQSLLPYLDPVGTIVDLACGNGLLTRLLLGKPQVQYAYSHTSVVTQADQLLLIAIDLSQTALRFARDRFTKGNEGGQSPASGKLPLIVQAAGDNLPLADCTVSALLLGNAIHCFIDKSRLLQGISRVLRPRAVFAFNTAFYVGSLAKGTESFYSEWVKQALRYLMAREVEWRAAGNSQPLRRRGRSQPAFSNPWLTPEGYVQLLEAHGFEVLHVGERTLMMEQRHFIGLSTCEGTWEAELASALMSGYPLPLACEALTRAVDSALATAGVEALPRSWLEVVAIKSAEGV